MVDALRDPRDLRNARLAVAVGVTAIAFAAIFFRRTAPTGPVVCLFNFTDGWHGVGEGWLRAQGVARMWDALSDGAVTVQDGVVGLPPQGRVWLL